MVKKKIKSVKLVKSMPTKGPSNQLKLYSVTTLHMKDRYGSNWPGDRCVAICSTVNSAKELVEGNYGDIYEDGYYQYVVIEALMSDQVYAGCMKEQYWYKWSVRGNAYIALKKAPKIFRNIINFGVG